MWIEISVVANRNLTPDGWYFTVNNRHCAQGQEIEFSGGGWDCGD